MSNNVVIDFPAEKAGSYVAAIDMAIALCMNTNTHLVAGDYLSQLREVLFDAIIKVDNDKN